MVVSPLIEPTSIEKTGRPCGGARSAEAGGVFGIIEPPLKLLRACFGGDCFSAGLGERLDFLDTLFVFPFLFLFLFPAIWVTTRFELGLLIYYYAWTWILIRVGRGLALRGLDRPCD